MLDCSAAAATGGELARAVRAGSWGVLPAAGPDSASGRGSEGPDPTSRGRRLPGDRAETPSPCPRPYRVRLTESYRPLQDR